MKKTFSIVNILLISLVLILDILYMCIGGLWLKSITSALFVSIGIVNLVYAIKNKENNLKFPIILVVALFIAMLGDIVLNINFIAGAIIFAIGHVFYFFAYCNLVKFEWKDLIYGVCILIPSVLIITLVPLFDFGGILMEVVCVVYAIIISMMVGKALSNYIKEKTLINLIILIGSILFFVSDLMLLFDVFSNLPRIMGVLCLATYYPGQCILAHSIIYMNKSKAD